MKNFKNTLLKSLLLIVLFTSGSIVLSGSGYSLSNQAQAAVSRFAVNKYLVMRGYTVITLDPIQGTENWTAHTILNGLHYRTTVYVQGSTIVSNEDILL